MFTFYISSKQINSFKLSESFSVDFLIKENQVSDLMDDEYVPVFEYINSKVANDPG
jgi:hypothetical protein